MRRLLTFWPVAVLVAVIVMACATSSNQDLEEARFALDSGDYETAVTKADAVLAADPTNVEAAIILSSAYAGRAGFRILNVSADVSEAENAESEFDVVHDALAVIHDSLAGSLTSLSDLRDSVVAIKDTLIPQPESTHELFRDQQFQMGSLEAIEAFGLPSLTAQPTVSGDIDQTDITDTERDVAQQDLIDADDHLIASGLEENDSLVTNIRKNWCVLRNASTAASGIDLAVLRDLTLCELTPEADRGGLAFESPTITACTDFDFDACDGAGDSELDS